MQSIWSRISVSAAFGRLAVVVIAVLVVLVAPGQAPARASDEDVQAALHKANLYIEIAKTTGRVVESWDRYKSWVNMKTGPTGKEFYISYGMYDVSDFAEMLDVTRSAIGTAPSSPKLDALMTPYLDAYEAVAPVINQASAYYEREGYKQDNAAEGQALHKKMVPLVTTFVAEREVMMPELRAFMREVERQEIAGIEAREGRTAAWHAGQVQYAASRVLDTFPRVRPEPMTSEMLDEQMAAIGPNTPGEKFEELMSGVVKPVGVTIDVTAFEAALKDYETAVAAFDAFAGEKHEDWDDLKPLPKQLLDMLRAFRDPLVKNGGKEFEGGGQMVSQIVQVYFDLMNAVSPIARTQLRYLP